LRLIQTTATYTDWHVIFAKVLGKPITCASHRFHVSLIITTVVVGVLFAARTAGRHANPILPVPEEASMARNGNAGDEAPHDDQRGVSRRGFLTSVGTGALSVAAASKLAAQPLTASEVLDAHEMSKITLHINGRTKEVLVEPRWSLAFVLREKLGITGTKIGCDRGECGACTVLIDSVPRYACLTLAVEAEGTEIMTVEGLMDGEEIGPVQQSFVEKDAYQCGYCTSGQIMAAEGLLLANPNPSLAEIQHSMSGNLCRCGAYPHIFAAAQRAAELKRGGGGES
jgi:xanthine dehydrogenase YagT iron-sulfur-binding subunit